MKKLTFDNKTLSELCERPMLDSVVIDGLESAKTIMQWYGSHYAGDDYTVTLDGQVLLHDANGEYLEPTIGGNHGELSNNWQMKDVTPEAKQ